MLKLCNLKCVAHRVDLASFVVSTDTTCGHGRSQDRAAVVREREKVNAKLDLSKYGQAYIPAFRGVCMFPKTMEKMKTWC